LATNRIVLQRRAATLWAVASRIAPLLIVAVGAILRLSNIGLIRHTYDYAYPIYDALRILDGRQILTLGQPASVFLNNPPLMDYIQAIPLRLWDSPYAVYLFIILLNTAAIWFVYLTARALLGEWAALVAALLYAVNPWLVFDSRATWCPALMPLWTTLIAWGLWPAMSTERGDWRRVTVGFGALVAMMGAYIQSWGLLAQVVPLAALFRRRLPRKGIVIGAVLLALLVLLYGLALAQNLDVDRNNLARFFSGGPLKLSRTALEHALRLVTGRDFDYVYTREMTADYTWRRLASLAAGYALALALAAGAVRAALSLRRPGAGRRVAAVLLIWFLVPVLLMSVTSHPVNPNYLLLSCPAGTLLAAWGIDALPRQRWARYGAAVGLAAIALLFSLNLQRAADQVAAQPLEPGFENWSLSLAARMGRLVRDLAGNGPRPIRIAAEGNEAMLTSASGRYVTTLHGLDYPNYVVLPGLEPLLYVLSNRPVERGALGPLEETFPQETIEGPGGQSVSFVRVQPYSREAALALPAVKLDWPSEAGLTLLGYTLSGERRAGEPLICTTYWRVDELKADRWQWFVGAFYHLRDQTGREVANVSGHGQWASQWRLGDVYVERMSIPVPADARRGVYQFEFGLFDTIHNRNYSLEVLNAHCYAQVVPVRIRTAPS